LVAVAPSRPDAIVCRRPGCQDVREAGCGGDQLPGRSAARPRRASADLRGTTLTHLKRIGLIAMLGALAASLSPATAAQPDEQVRHAISLTGISVVAEDDVWVVGIRDGTRPFAEHWDGDAWTQSRMPYFGHRGYVWLNAVDALASDNVWAVGRSPHTFSGSPMIMHFDGKSWTRYEPAVIHRLTGEFSGVSAASPTNVWMVGHVTEGSQRALAVHWDGEEFTRPEIQDPRSGTSSFLGVCAPDDGHAFAVGANEKSDTTQPLAEEWDGARWLLERTATLGKRSSTFQAVTCSTDADVWAVGHANSSTRDKGLVEHRTASGWAQVQTGGQTNVDLTGVVQVAIGEVWAVGSRSTQGGAVVDPWVEHGTGEDWTGTTVPHKNNGAHLTAVDADAPDDVWVAGNDGEGHVVVDRWNGTTWVRML
jgi:hypothetical protein